MKRISSLLWVLMLLPAFAFAQTRYEDEVFTDVDITLDVKYGENYSVLSGTPALINLQMDIYEPADDTVGGPHYAGQRPVILLFHAGSFLPKSAFLPFGDKRDSVMIELATQFAKRGFVAASVGYRIGWNPLASGQPAKANSIINAVYRAMQDAHAAVRWFRKDADANNDYNIDPYRIVVGGSNSGGYVALALGNLNKLSEIELAKFRDPVSGDLFINQDLVGGFYGEGGTVGVNVLNNPGYSSAVQLILNLGGAAGDSTWIEAGEPPVVSFHGAADALTPFATGTVIVSATGDPVVEVTGSADIALRQHNVGNNDIWINANFTDPVTTVAEGRNPAYEGLFWFGAGYGQPAAANGFEPWAWYDTNEPRIIDAGNPSPSFPGPYTGYGSALNPYASREKAETYIDTIMQYFIPRLLVALDPANIDSTAVETADPATEPVGINDLAVINSMINIYPNPTSGGLNIHLGDHNYSLAKIELFDITGRLVLSDSKVADPQYHRVALEGINRGTYVVTLSLASGEQVSKRLIVQ